MTEPQKRHPVVAIVGRPNVGKSSLFNAIVKRRLAIVHEMSGVTRDRVGAMALFEGRRFRLVDTGGLGVLSGESRGVDMWDSSIRRQVAAAVDASDVVIFLGDALDGVTPLDKDIASMLRTSGRPVVVAANKCDGDELKNDAAEFSSLGFGNVFPLCCLHREGVAALLREVMTYIPEENFAPPPSVPTVRIAIVGRPNVGKSTIVNALVGEERVMASPVAGTTRDAVDVGFMLPGSKGDMKAVLVDTAGIRKASKVDGVVEFFSVMRAKSAIERADVVLVVVEAGSGAVTAQDRRIAGLVETAGRPCIVVVNKTDLCPKLSKRELETELRETIPGLSYAPCVFVSATNRSGLDGLKTAVVGLAERLDTAITTGVLNRVISEAMEERVPPTVGNSHLKVYYSSLVGSRPPRILMFVNRPDLAPDSYVTYLRKRIRTAFDLEGMPVEVELRARPKTIRSFHTQSRNVKRRK
ncbi:MAG: ribosome biogenesis GTPase Der [Victivallaceae bacterium]|nr:ribosome biogenesis GTPase Der [Victivallaceae bacterium]